MRAVDYGAKNPVCTAILSVEDQLQCCPNQQTLLESPSVALGSIPSGSCKFSKEVLILPLVMQRTAAKPSKRSVRLG
jgi:hypothetical protein